MATATGKQKGLIWALIREKGLSTKYVDATYKGVLTMRERSSAGRVEDWVNSLTRAEASDVIDALQRK